jgi:hypothetical protein
MMGYMATKRGLDAVSKGHWDHCGREAQMFGGATGSRVRGDPSKPCQSWLTWKV